MKLHITSKKLQINKAQSTIIIILASTVALSIFCLVSAKQLWSQAGFQRQVINAKRDAANALKADVMAAGQLTNRYNTIFNNPSSTRNVLSGKNTASTQAQPPDGDNARIVLDALPTGYDFPALISSLTKILNDNHIINPGISGSDQATTADDTPSAEPEPVPIQLTISGTGNASSVKRLIRDLERSIRPFDITNLQLRGSDAVMSVSINLKTYYQPAKSLTIGTKVIK